MQATIDALTDTRREILLRIKKSGRATISDVARHLDISDEGARQHLMRLERQGWVVRRTQRTNEGRSGRPACVFEVSDVGEALFPKRYDELSIALIDTVLEICGTDVVKKALESVADAWVEAWEPVLRGKSTEERLELLRNYYVVDDPFISIEKNGHVSLVERNCPFLTVALARPSLCSITVNTLTRLLGVRVRRQRKFQDGDGCCEFRVLTSQPLNPSDVRFRLEAEIEEADDTAP